MAGEWEVVGGPGAVPSGYMGDDEFSAAMNRVFGAGKWQETGGWRSQNREAQLRAQGAQTVAPGHVSAHTQGNIEAPGAHDIVVQGLTPEQAAARLRAEGLSPASAFPEGSHGGQGAHLHLALQEGEHDPWSVTDGPGAADPWDVVDGAGAKPKPAAAALQAPFEEQRRLLGSAVGGVLSGGSKVIKGAGELIDLAVRQQAQAASQGVLPGQPGELPIITPPEDRPEYAAYSAHPQPIVAPMTDVAAGKLSDWDVMVAPQDRAGAESALHAGGEMVAPIAAAVVDPLLGGAAFGSQGYGETHEEALQHGALEATAERAGLESGAVQGVLGMTPVGEIAAPIVRGVKGAIPSFLARLGVNTAANAALGGGMQVGQNVVAETNYDPNRPWYFNVPQAAGEMALGGAGLHLAHEGVSAAVNRLRPRDSAPPAESPAAAPETPQEGVPVPARPEMPEAVAAQAYAQNSAHLNGAVTPDNVPVEPVEPPKPYEEARIAEGAPVEDMAPAIADVAEYRSAAPRGYTLFQAMKDLGGIRTKDAEGAPIGDVQQLLDGVRRPGLINNKAGLTPDGMREALQQRGWFGEYSGEGARPGDDINDLYGLMAEEGRGNKVFHPTDVSPETILRRAELERDMAMAGATPKDTVEVAAAKVAAYRAAEEKERGIARELLGARADALGLTNHEHTSHDELLGDVLEREAIQGENDGDVIDERERVLDEHLTPDEHEWLTAAQGRPEGEPAQAGGIEGAGDGAAPVAPTPQGDRELGAGAGGDRHDAAEVPGEDQLGPAERQNIGGETVEQGLIPGTEQSARQAAAAREGALKPTVPQKDAGDLFAPPEPDQADLKFQRPGGLEEETHKIRELLKAAEDNKSAHIRAFIGQAPEWLEHLASGVGMKLDGFRHVLDTSAVRHILKNHGDPRTETSRGQLAMTEADFERLPEVLSSPDQIVLGSKTTGGNPAILYLKRAEDGSTLVVEEVRSARHQLVTKSMWRYPAAKDVPDILRSLLPNVRRSLKSAPGGGDGLKIIADPSGRNPTDETAKFRRGHEAAFGEGAKLLARGLEGVAPDRVSSQAHEKLISDVDRIIRKIAPIAQSRPMRAMREPVSGNRVEAAAWREGQRHVIAWSLDTADAIGAARHEAVHALRAQGVFKPKEWDALSGAAHEENWLGRYNIPERYPDLDAEGQVEEAIAERFADWRRDKQSFLPAFVRELFRRIQDVLQQVAATTRKVFGRDATADDVFQAMERGEIGARGIERQPAPAHGGEFAPAFQRPRGEDPEGTKARGFINKALGEGVDAIGARIKRTADRVLPDPVKEVLDSARLGVSPMAAGSERAKATAKDFANTLRETAWEWGRVDTWLEKNFTTDQRARIWTAADEESVIRQRGGEPGPNEGLNRLAPSERAAVDELQRRADDAFARAKALGMTKADPLPSYVPRMVVEMTGEGAQRVKGRSGEGGGGKTGRNLTTSTGQLRHREHMTVEETEAAAKAAFGEGATVIRDIRTLGLATGKLEQAIAGRTLINKIREVGQQTGQDVVTEGASSEPADYFTIDHPAMKTWGPKFVVDHETGKLTTVTGPDGKPVMEARPLYVSKEFEGPLKAVLSTPTGPLYNAVLSLKGKMMSIIMFSPLMHNAVIWGKAIPAAPRDVLSFQVYAKGNQAKNDPAIMREAIQAGLDPIGRNFAQTQDITGIAAPKQIAPGQSWTAQLVSAVPSLFSKSAGDATKLAIDRLGDVWHNKFLWDRVADLQMGLYKTIRDSEIKKGLDPQSAQRLAAHFANRYAGALPIEGMSKISRQIANVLLFSRSFTLGNLGAYKDIVRGLPGEVQAQIMRDSGAESLNQVQGEARRKAVGMLALDVALSYAGLWLAAGAVSMVTHQFNSPAENEPGKEHKFLIRYEPDGTAVYGRLPTGKVGEDLQEWATEPMETLKAKLSPFGRLLYEVAANDKGFGRKLYDPYDKTPLGLVKNVGRVIWAAMSSVAPQGVVQGAADLVTGKGDRTTAAMQTFLPAAGITVSKGAPGGPALADLYQTKDRHDFEVQEKLPAIMDQVRAGDIQGARQKFSELGIPPGLASYYVRVARNPSMRLTPKKIQEFNRAATLAERAKFQRDRAASDARAGSE